MREIQPLPQSVAAHTIRRIAYPITVSSTPENGFTWAIHLTQEYQAELLVFHLVPPPTPFFELESPIKVKAEAALSMLLAKLQTAGLKAQGFLLTGTKTTDTKIVLAARLQDVDLIVMETRHRTGICQLFTSSLESRVISRAHCPVLVVPS